MPIGTVQPNPEHPDDPPYVCLKINKSWVSYLIGALAPLKYPEYWSGTLEENRQARWDTNNLIDQLMTAVECEDEMVTVNCCCEDKVVIERVNPITLQIEISIDGGETWGEKPGGLSTIVTEMPPPVTSGVSANKCEAAGNGRAHIEDLIQNVHDAKTGDLSLTDFIIAIATGIMGLIALWLSAGALALAVVEIFTAIFAAIHGVREMDIGAFDAYWTTDERHKILCALYCTIGEDGRFTSEQYSSFMSRWKADAVGGDAFEGVYAQVQVIGRTGLNNLCAYGEGAGTDCSDCDCGCDPTIWQIGNVPGFNVTGTIDEVGVDFIIASTALFDGFYYLTLITADPDLCCCVTEFEMVSGELPPGNRIPCGSEQVVGNILGEPLTCLEAGQVNYLAWQSATPFTVKIKFS